MNKCWSHDRDSLPSEIGRYLRTEGRGTKSNPNDQIKVSCSDTLSLDDVAGLHATEARGGAP
jgi:hypothetical protein